MDFLKQLKHQLEYQIENLVKITPDISLIIVLCTLLLTLFVTLDFINPYSLMLDWSAIRNDYQYYRLITSCLYTGKLSFQWILFLYTNVKYMVMIEKQFQGKQIQFIFMLIFIATLLIISSLFFPMYYPSFQFYESLTYIWTKFNPTSIITLFNIIPIQAKYLPIVNVVMKIVQQQNILFSLISIAVGHLYWMVYCFIIKHEQAQQQNPPQQHQNNQNGFVGRAARF